MSPKPAHERVLRRIDTSDPDVCWLWPGALSIGGYAVVRRTSRSEDGNVYAHRATYEALVAPIPPGYQIDHLCRVRNCVNPKHLEPVTPRTNLLRGENPAAKAARRSTCVNGHDYTPDNTYVYRGTRQCRICRDRHRAAWRARLAVGESASSTSPTPAVTP